MIRRRSGVSPVVPVAPRRCVDLELGAVPGELLRQQDEQVEVLARIHGSPVGSGAFCVAGSDDTEALVEAVVARFAEPIREHLARDGVTVAGPAWSDLLLAIRQPRQCAQRLEAPTPAPAADMVVATVGRRPLLRDAVAALLEQDYPGPFRVIVVDNDPRSGGARELLRDFDDPRLELIAEPRRGVSWARNAGLAACNAEFIAFTDDDTRADPGWLRALVATLACDQRVHAVTGLVLPESLETAEAQWFESGVGFSKGYRRLVWSERRDRRVDRLGPPGDERRLFPYSAGQFGSGNNMAFRVDALRALGGSDPALGAGTPSEGGEDLDLFFRTIRSGGVLIYEPRAIVRHNHRRDYESLRAQLHGYGVGLAAFLTREALCEKGALLGMVRLVPRGVWWMFSPRSGKNAGRGEAFPPALVRAERCGFAWGPARYLRARHQLHPRRRGSTP